MKSIIVLAVVISIGLLNSCDYCIPAEGPQVTKELQLEEFQRLEVNLPASVQIRIADVPSITVTAPKSIFKSLKTPAGDGVLKIETSPCISADNDEIQIELSVISLKSIVINGSGSIIMNDSLLVEKLRLKINGSGEMRLDKVITNQLDFDLNGSGKAIVKGMTEELEVQINGSGSFNGLGLLTSETEAKINGSGNAKVHATDNLSVKVLGSGRLHYKGNPQIKTNISGSGSVAKIDQ